MNPINGLKEKALRNLIEKGEELYLLLEWNQHSNDFRLSTKINNDDKQYDILTWKGHLKTAKDDILIISWAKDLGFKGIKWKQIEFLKK